MAMTDALGPFAEVISSLDASKIPDKLHCPSCDKFLLNGWKLPCCDQTICETCHSAISDRCPICEHQPMSQDLCKPNKALRNTAKAYLKTAEKKLADERARAVAADGPPPVAASPKPELQQPATMHDHPHTQELPALEDMVFTTNVKLEESTSSIAQHPLADDPQPSIEVPPAQAAVVSFSPPAEANPVEGSRGLAEESGDALPQYPQGGKVNRSQDKEPQDVASQDQEQSKANGAISATLGMVSNMNAAGFSNMGMNIGFNNNMDYSQMMQYMAANGMTNFNMMGMPNMGMNPMSQGIFGGFGSPNLGMAGMNGMNGMNMGMNFDPSQGMYGTGFGQNSNMWNGLQNNNPNAFANGMGGDFGPNSGYGYNMSQQGNFHQHQYPNGDFQGGQYGRGYGRGRGRGRGGFSRGRGYNQNVQGNHSNYQQPYEQQQQEIQNMQAQMYTDHANESAQSEQVESDIQSPHKEPQDQLNFAPGGQEEVQEALGDDYPKTESNGAPEAPMKEGVMPEEKAEVQRELETKVTKDELQIQDEAESTRPIPTLSPTTYDDVLPPVEEITAAAIQPEFIQPSMPPPSAPLGPAAQFADPGKDYGLRGRGHGRMSSRGRGTFHAPNGPSLAPLKAVSEPAFKPPFEPKGTGVVGAPTGPKAMRTPTVNGTIRGRGGGFQIVGRASMTSQGSVSVASEKSRSITPASAQADRNHGSRSPSRHRSRHHRRSHQQSEDEDDYERRRERRHRKSRNEDYEDYEMQEGDRDRPRSVTPEESRRSSRRRDRDKDRHSSSTKHKSSRSHRHRDEAQSEGDYEMDEHNAEPRSNRDMVEIESRSSRRDHRSSKSSRHEEKEREDSHHRRKRSRRDRDEVDDIEEDQDEDSRHHSRRHKRDHHHNDESVNGRQQRSERSSAAATPVEREPEKDMHTLEREARNRERMLKEQQRRENVLNAEKGEGGPGGGKRRSVAGGRRVSYKYEDEAQSAMVEQEREAQRWR